METPKAAFVTLERQLGGGWAEVVGSDGAGWDGQEAQVPSVVGCRLSSSASRGVLTVTLYC